MRRFDYAGISIVIAGSFFPPIYYGMYCNSNLAVFYLSIIAVLATVVFVISLFEWVYRNLKMKSMLFGGFGAFFVIPISHMLLNEYLGDSADTFTFAHCVPVVVCVALSYLLGMFIYATQ